MIGGRLNRPRDRCRLTVSCAFKLWIFLRLKLPTRERLFPCTRCYGAIPVLGVWEYLYGTLRVQMVTEGGDFRQPFTRLTGWRNPPLTNRRSVVAVDLTTGLPFHCNDNLLGSRQLRGIEPGSSRLGVRSSIHYAIHSRLWKGLCDLTNHQALTEL